MHGIPQRYSFSLRTEILNTISLSSPLISQAPSFLNNLQLRDCLQSSNCSKLQWLVSNASFHMM